MTETTVAAVRAGSSQSRQNEAAFGILSSELVLFSIFGGVYFGSWLVFGAIMVGSGILLMHAISRTVLMIAFSFAWCGLGAAIGNYFESPGAAITLGVIGLIWGFGIHAMAVQHFEDLSK